jgi:hypothetical protein
MKILGYLHDWHARKSNKFDENYLQSCVILAQTDPGFLRPKSEPEVIEVQVRRRVPQGLYVTLIDLSESCAMEAENTAHESLYERITKRDYENRRIKQEALMKESVEKIRRFRNSEGKAY